MPVNRARMGKRSAAAHANMAGMIKLPGPRMGALVADGTKADGGLARIMRQPLPPLQHQAPKRLPFTMQLRPPQDRNPNVALIGRANGTAIVKPPARPVMAMRLDGRMARKPGAVFTETRMGALTGNPKRLVKARGRIAPSTPDRAATATSAGRIGAKTSHVPGRLKLARRAKAASLPIQIHLSRSCHS